MKKLLVLFATLALCACTSTKPMPTVDHVNLERFMGDWYVLANIPTFIERNAHNAIENYKLDDAGNIDTTFTFRAGAFDGPLKTYTPKGFVKDNKSNALWLMQFVWPIKADYRIVYLNQDYSQVIIARKARDYVWIMARTPQISEQDYTQLVDRVEALGYDIIKLAKVPQSWPLDNK